jgi:hypothetical protein
MRPSLIYARANEKRVLSLPGAKMEQIKSQAIEPDDLILV